MIKRLLIFITVLTFAFPLIAQEESGREIMEKSYNRDDGQDSRVKVEMNLIDKNENENVRQLLLYSKDYGELIKTFIEFTAPADIKGTKFISWENTDGDDTQYLYLPELGRARRIVSSQKNLSFVNTDFTYEDIQRRLPDKDSHKLLREEKIEGVDFYVIESTPIDPANSQYSKRINWVEKHTLIVVKIDLFDKKNELTKTFWADYLRKLDGIWTVMVSTMKDLDNNHKTVMKIEEATYNGGLSDDIFTLRNLEQK